MIVIIPMAAALVTGLFLGWVLSASYAAAATSRSQERMQSKVSYWQDRAIQLQEKLEARGTRPEPPSRQWWQ
jgi:hypothetical protein